MVFVEMDIRATVWGCVVCGDICGGRSCGDGVDVGVCDGGAGADKVDGHGVDIGRGGELAQLVRAWGM